MKEAIITDLDGFYVEPTIVEDADDGVKDNEKTGYIVAVKVPEGLHKPKWNTLTEAWEEGLPQSEITSLAAKANAPTIEQRLAAAEAAIIALKLQVAPKS